MSASAYPTVRLNLRYNVESLLRAALFLALLCLSVTASAEGSKDIYPSNYYTYYFGGDKRGEVARCYRAMLVSGTASDRPFPTYGTMKVYAKAGEHIYLASSALNSASGTSTGSIVWRSPDGRSGTISNNANGGYIANRTQELAGPQYGTNTGGSRYKAYKITVTAATEGVWEIDFRSKATSLTKTPYNSSSKGSPHSSYVHDGGGWVENETTPTNIKNVNTAVENVYVSAFDITVTNAADNQVIEGRAYANVLNMAVWGAKDYAAQWCATFYVLTNTGYMYQLEPNGMSGDALCIYSNNKGVQTGYSGQTKWNGGGVYPPTNYSSCEGGQPSYKSVAFGNSSVDIYDPRRPDNVHTYKDADGNDVEYYEDVTHKIFFNKPSADLPQKAKCVYGGEVTTTWLRKELGAGLPKISDIKFVGKEGGKEGIWGPEGCNIVFNADVQGSYSIEIVFADSKFASRIFEGTCVEGKNMIIWDGKDGDGNDFDGSCDITPSATIKAAEVHFPFANIYRNVNGYRLLLLDPSSGSELSRMMYWNDNNSLPNSTVGSYDSPLDGTGGYECRDEAWPSKADDNKSLTQYGHSWGIKYKYWFSYTYQRRGEGAIIDTWSYASNKTDGTTQKFKVQKLDLAVTSLDPSPTTAHVRESISFSFTVKNLKENGAWNADADSASVGVWFENGGFYTTKFELLSSTDASTKILNQASEEEKELCYIYLKSGAEAKVRITGYLESRHAHSYAQPKAFVMRPGDVQEKDANNKSGDGAPIDPLLEYEGKSNNNIKDFPQLFLLNTAPAPVDDEYSAAENSTFVDNVLVNDNDVDNDALSVVNFTVDGVQYAAGATASIVGVGDLSIAADGAITLVTGDELFSSFTCSYTVSDNFAGTYLTDQDLIPGTASAEVKFTYGQNRIPRVEPMAVTIKSSRNPVELPINIYDLDGDPLTISISGANASKFSVGGDRLYYIGGARSTQAVYHFNVSVSDGTVTTVKEIVVTVEPINPPTLEPSSVTLELPRGQKGTVVVPVVIKSDDGVALVPNGAVMGSTDFEVKDGNVYFIANGTNTNKTSTHNLTINVKDGEGLEYYLSLIVNIKIKKVASATISVTAKDGIYGNTVADVLSYSVTNPAGCSGVWEFKDQNYISYETTDALSVGQYHFQVTFCPDPNNAFGIKENVVQYVDFKITKRRIVLNSGSGTWVYDQLAHRNETVTMADDSDPFYDTDGLTFTNFASQTDVGSCENSFSYFPKSGTDLDNYEIVVNKGTLEVTVREAAENEMVVELSDAAFVYDKNAHEPAVTLYIGGKVVPASEYSVAYADNVYVGSATVTITDNAGGNYNMATVSRNFEITPREVTLNWPQTSFVYSGVEHEVSC